MHMKKQRGYTLVEMLISIAVGMVILAVIYAAVNMGQRSTVNVERKVAAHQDTRASLGLMALEIEMASFNPTYASGVWSARKLHPGLRQPELPGDPGCDRNLDDRRVRQQ